MINKRESISLEIKVTASDNSHQQTIIMTQERRFRNIQGLLFSLISLEAGGLKTLLESIFDGDSFQPAFQVDFYCNFTLEKDLK